MVASHTEKPLGFSKWLGKATPHKYNLADMQGTRANHVAYPRAGWYYRVNPIPAIYFPSLMRTVTVGSQSPGGQLYGWLPLSDASGIISLRPCISILFPSAMSFCYWAILISELDAADCIFGKTGFCQEIFEFWAQIKGIFLNKLFLGWK